MKITHIGIWTKQLEVLRSFYTTYFQGKSHAKYINPKKGFESYMLHFEGGCTLEIMSRTDVDQVRNSEDREFIGFAHLAFSTGSKDQVDRLTERLRQAGYKRRTGFPVLTDYMRDLCPVLDVPDGQCR